MDFSPRPGRRHLWLLDASLQKVSELGAVHAPKIVEMLAQKLVEAGYPEHRALSDSRRAVEGAVAILGRDEHEANHDARLYAHWPEVDPSRVLEAVKSGFNLVRLQKLSPTDPTRYEPADLVNLLFPGNPYICCGRTAWNCETRRRLEWPREAFSEMALIVPNRMTAKWGTTLMGRRSQHSLSNTAKERDWLVIEIDLCEQDRSGQPMPEAPAFRLARQLQMNAQDICAAVLHRIFANGPEPALIVDSAGKSLHAWLNWREKSGVEAEHLLRQACQFGADSATWRRCQLVRMPAGKRGGKLQRVVYLDLTQL
jgi:hypothetical protein